MCAKRLSVCGGWSSLDYASFGQRSYVPYALQPGEDAPLSMASFPLNSSSFLTRACEWCMSLFWMKHGHSVAIFVTSLYSTVQCYLRPDTHNLEKCNFTQHKRLEHATLSLRFLEPFFSFSHYVHEARCRSLYHRVGRGSCHIPRDVDQWCWPGVLLCATTSIQLSGD